MAPEIADPKLKARLAAAVAAAGVKNLSALVDLLADAGAMALPPSGGRTSKKYSIEDLGMRLWGLICRVPPLERGAWFGELCDLQRAAVITVMRDRGVRTESIASDLGLDPVEVTRVWNEYADRIGEMVVGLRLPTIAGHMQLAAERAQEIALEKNDPATFWRIEKEKIGKMQDLGIIDRAIHRVEHTHRFGEAKKVELDALVRLEYLKRNREEEIKLIESSDRFDSDPVPIDSGSYDD